MPDQPSSPPPVGDVVIIGGGPAGFTAAYELTKRGLTSTVLEGDSVVGGISRTVERDGYRFDIGGHRFFTKVPRVEEFWHEILEDDEFLTRPRESRIYYQSKFFAYPLKPISALRSLGIIEAIRCAVSFLWAHVRPPREQKSLEDYVVANYGWRLYSHFFKAYSEKVWAVPASEISADWGAQRIKGMSLWSAVWEPVRAKIVGRRDRGTQVTSLIEQFQYPKYGPGMMWERCRDKVVEAGTSVVMDAPVVRILHEDRKAVTVITRAGDGTETEYPADQVISSMPLSELVQIMDPPAPADVLAAAGDLEFRDFLSIALVVPEERVSWTDNWIYIHEPDVRTMRVQNFGSWSPYMVKDGHNVLGLEYTVTEGDEWWNSPDDALIRKGVAELDQMGLMKPEDVEAGYVVRMPKAYPMYDENYATNVDIVRAWIAEAVPNVHPVGRNGMHRYNNQDHSMYTAMLTVENIAEKTDHDVWSVNVDADYHEEVRNPDEGPGAGAAGTGRSAPIIPKRT